MLGFANGETVTVQRYRTDKHGDQIEVSKHSVDGCAFAPGYALAAAQTAEIDGRATTVTSDGVLYAPAGADFCAVDVVTRPDGTRWLVEGDPGPWASPFNPWQAGLVVRLQKRTG